MGVEAAVVHGLDGYDEISLTSDTRVFSTRKHFATLSVADFGTEALEPASLRGAETVEGNAAGPELQLPHAEHDGPPTVAAVLIDWFVHVHKKRRAHEFVIAVIRVGSTASTFMP